MTPEFNKFWDGDRLVDVPYKKGTPVYWAWQGWVAGQRAEREACVEICEGWGAWNKTAQDIADDIRMRGEGNG